MSLNLLVISYYFPPFEKVGGRRWAKHCKYLSKENINFFVLTGAHQGRSSWDKDLTLYIDRISRVHLPKINVPYFFGALPQNIFQKIRWKLSYLSWERRKKTLIGNYKDPSAVSEVDFYNAACEIIVKNNLNTVVLSGNPFYYSIILPKIKQRFPTLKCVMDYRDYWEDELEGLTDLQRKTEMDLQLKVLASCEMVTSPNKEMQDFYAEKFGKRSFLLPHCVDEEDFLEFEPSLDRVKRDTVKLIYGGAFYSGIEQNLEMITKFLDALNQRILTHADFYVSVRGFENETKSEHITRHNFIPANDYFKKVKKADCVLLILPANRVNAMSSKFFELVALKKPILYFGNEGMVSEFILKHKLGFHITLNNLEEQIAKVIDNLSNPHIPDLSYDINKHTFEYHTKRLIKELERL